MTLPSRIWHGFASLSLAAQAGVAAGAVVILALAFSSGSAWMAHRRDAQFDAWQKAQDAAIAERDHRIAEIEGAIEAIKQERDEARAAVLAKDKEVEAVAKKGKAQDVDLDKARRRYRDSRAPGGSSGGANPE